MRLVLIGNCQIGPLAPIMKASVENLDFIRLPPVNQMRPSDEKKVVDALEYSDYILSQPIADTYNIPFVRTSILKSAYGSKLVTWPNMYFKGYAPEYDVIRDAEYLNFPGPLSAYHSDKVIFGFMQGLSAGETVELTSKATKLDAAWYSTAVEDGLRDLAARENTLDVKISQYIANNFRRRRLFHIMNHPTTPLLVQTAYRLLDCINAKANKCHYRYFNDFDMLESSYPENPYIIEKYELGYRTSNYYRGVELHSAENIIGTTSGGPKIYSRMEMVEAFYYLYTRHYDRLKEHVRVKNIMSRRTSGVS